MSRAKKAPIVKCERCGETGDLKVRQSPGGVIRHKFCGGKVKVST